MLFTLTEKNNSNDAKISIDYFSLTEKNGAIMMSSQSLSATANASSSSTDAQTTRFGCRSTAEMVELGMYRSFSVKKKSEHISGMLPVYRWIGIQPEALDKINAQSHGVARWGKPFSPCGLDNLFAYNDNGDVILHYAITETTLAAEKVSRPWMFSRYEQSTSTWNHLFHLSSPNKAAWVNHISNPTHQSVHSMKQCADGTRALWAEVSDVSSFTLGNYVDDHLEGKGATVSHANHETSYYSGEFKKNMKEGQGTELLLNTLIGGAMFFQGKWFQDKRHGYFVVDFTSKVPETNRTERGTYHMDAAVGLWSVQLKDGRLGWSQDSYYMLAGKSEEPSHFYVIEENQSPRFLPATEFLSGLFANECHELIAKMIEEQPHQTLLDIGALSVKNGDDRLPVVCFAYRVASIQPDFLHHPSCIDNTRLFTLLKLALQMLATAPKSPLYVAVKNAVDLYAPNINQKTIVDQLMKIFPEVRYAEVHKKHVSRAIETYQKNVKQHYVIGMLERIHIICSLLAETSRAETQPLKQLLAELLQADQRLTEQHEQDVKRAGAERAIQQEQAQWTKVCLGLDDSVLAFMRELRADEKSTRTAIVERFQSATKLVLASKTVKPQDPVKTSRQTLAAVSAVNTVALKRESLFSRSSISVSMNPSSSTHQRSPVPAAPSVRSDKNSVRVTQVRGRPDSLDESRILHKGNEPKPQRVIRYPLVVRALLDKYPSDCINDCLLIYKGMVIKSLQRLNQPISSEEAACLRAAQVKESQYFLGLRNAFLNHSHSVLHAPLRTAADLHARAWIMLSKGNRINLDDVVAFFKDESTPKRTIKKILTFKETSAPERSLISDEAVLHKIIFGLLIESCDEMGLGELVDRQLFIGDYREYLHEIRTMVLAAAAENSQRLMSDLESTALSCFKRAVELPRTPQFEAHVLPVRSL